MISAAASLKLCLVVKCVYDIPSILALKTFLIPQFQLLRDFKVALIDFRHLILTFDVEEDFKKVWLRETLVFPDFLFRFLRWSPEYSPSPERNIVSAWINMGDAVPLH
ncbi:hypothetical protein KSP40_PGU022144 [Platanthera guangdongensis]|uniref:DUF4283 domain-containing protein n=1 Tax=Platanthera guangdongensis TaxID=2320717 RepID=A0ABR2MS12_9ASPA